MFGANNQTGSKFLALVVIVSLLPILANFYKFYIQKDYDLFIEVSCNSSEEICFERDCENEECPPNGLSTYKQFNLKAKDFSKCEDKSCKDECEKGIIHCEEIVCGKNIDDVCSNNEL